MSYQPLDIALQDLSNTPDSPSPKNDQVLILDVDSDYSETSVVFDTLSYAVKAPLNFSSQSVVDDPDKVFESQEYAKDRGPQFLRKTCGFIFFVGIITWLLAIIVYSNTNIRTAAQLWHSQSLNKVTGLENRNITLNSYSPDHKNVSLDSYQKGTYRSLPVLVRWLHPSQFPKTQTEGGRGFYLTYKNKQFVICQADSTFRQIVLDNIQFEYGNNFVYAENVVLNPGYSVDDSEKWRLIRLDSVRQWRHSSFSLFWLWKPSTNEFIPLRPPEESRRGQKLLQKLHFADFDPSGKYVLYGFNHDLYLVQLSNLETTRITDNGSSNIFNGKPDWVYEEEVVASDRLFWWSPDLKFLAFASTNDTKVSEFPIEYFTEPSDVIMSFDEESSKSNDNKKLYPKVSKLKYPKVGSHDPIISMFCYDVLTRKSQEILSIADEVIGEDFILYTAAWMSKNQLLMKVADRTSSVEEKKLFTPSEGIELISHINASSYNGWIEKQTRPTLLSNDKEGTLYLDHVVVDSIVQLALFQDIKNENYTSLLGPATLDKSVIYDNVEGVVYGIFGTDLNQTFGLVNLNTQEFTALANPGIYDAHFSSDGQFVNLKYLGPDEPWQKILNMGLWVEHGVNIDSADPIDNVSHLATILKETNLPTHIRSTITIGAGNQKVELNIMEIFPPNFEERKKYPLLVHVYGGPGSVKIDDTFNIDFQDVISSELNAVVLIIDPRGTGRDNWLKKSYAKGNIGYWEPRDVTAVTKMYIKSSKFIDEEKTAIWGWSYGGFTSLKTLEHDKGETIKYGMAVAPVTNWLFYDSIYTERYMDLPKDNRNYEEARLKDFASFSSVKRFLLMHGTADDNVHVQNTLWFMDKLNIANVENYDVHFFPDSDHSIYHHNANKLVFEKLLWWLERAFMGYYN